MTARASIKMCSQNDVNKAIETAGLAGIFEGVDFTIDAENCKLDFLPDRQEEFKKLSDELIRFRYHFDGTPVATPEPC